MFNLGFSELLIVGVIALIFIGPKELPDIARVIGRMLNELKRATGDLSATVLKPKQQLEEEFRSTFQSLQQSTLNTDQKESSPETSLSEGTKKDESKS